MDDNRDNRPVRRRYTITGVVQGVGYRYFARRAAAQLGVGGWVANQEDGSVVVEAEAPPGVLADFLALLRRGPASSEVSDILVQDVEIQGERDFRIESSW